MFPFYTSWKHQKTFGFLVFSGDLTWENLPKMGLSKSIKCSGMSEAFSGLFQACKMEHFAKHLFILRNIFAEHSS